MRKIIRLLCALVALLFGLMPASALTASCDPSAQTTIFFVNGVWNPKRTTALQSLWALEDLSSAPNGTSAYQYQLAYNPGDGYFSDLVEAFGQKYGINADTSMLTLWVLGDVVPTTIDIAYTRDLGLKTIGKYLKPQTTLAVLKQHIAQYRAAISSGSKVVAIAHSQGNFFVNAAIEDQTNGLSFQEQLSFTIVSVANPDDHVATGGRSMSPVTLNEDTVIGIIPFAMPANYTNGTIDTPNGDYSKHAFIASYLQAGYDSSVPRTGAKNSLPAILDRIARADAATGVPICPSAGSTRDIWTTNVYSFTGAGGGPGGGLNNDELVVGGWGDEYRSLLQFDLSALPKTASSVTLRLFDLSTHAGSNGPIMMYVDQVISDWDWTTQPITPDSPDNLRLWWVNRPASQQIALVAAPTAGSYYDIDITALYNQWQSGTPNFGVQLRPTDTNNFWNVFGSSEHADPTRRPQLIVTPGTPPPPPPPPPIGPM